MVNSVLEMTSKELKLCMMPDLYTLALLTYFHLLLFLLRFQSKPVVLPGVKKNDTADEISEVEWHDIDCGSYHTAAVTPTGDLYTWGRGCWGRLGHGNNEKEDKPKHVTSLIGKKVVHVQCGNIHTAVVTSDGDLYTWYVCIDFKYLTLETKRCWKH